ncbi:DJ-1/PfpI family protein [Salinisphaera aquimarina]|uniref:DJ-1/PfpI family protein n=1 Tax=Salinisphaera aquimarina TaxID=2094031 RepID=A0ABV7EY97_9GAMM
MRFGFLVFDDLEELDLLGPWELIGVWATQFGGPEHCLLVGEHDRPVRCAKGLMLRPDATFDSCAALDYLLIPGGRGTRREVDNPRLIDFVTTQARQCQAVLSVCTGSFVLHRAGLLSGRPATTHWASLDRLRALGDVDVVEQRYTHSDTIWTSAGISAGMDMTLAFIAATAGAETAGEVQRWAEYYPDGVRHGSAHTAPGLPAYINEAPE